MTTSNISKKERHDFTYETLEWSNSYKGGDPVMPILDIQERLANVEKRLLIIENTQGWHDKYPALKAAYDEYKTIEGLILNGNSQA